MSTNKLQDELTKSQLQRQDFVDNEIYELINRLNPSQEKIEWDIEMISAARDVIGRWLTDKLAVTDEMSFYPYLEE